MRIGEYQVDAVLAGSARLDGGAMFGIVPRVVWERRSPPDDQHRVEVALRCLLLRGNGRTVVVDTGIGDKGADRFDLRFGISPARDPERSRLERALAALQVDPATVTDCILTHLHWDHAGGATVPIPDAGETEPAAHGFRPQFPNAVYYVQREHHAWASAPSERDAGSFRSEDWLPLKDQLRLLDGAQEIFSGVHLRLSNGHTPALQLVEVRDGERGGLVYCADLIPTSLHLRPAWVMGYDLFPATGVREKRELVEEAARQDRVLFFEHDPAMAAARITMEGDIPVVLEAVSL